MATYYPIFRILGSRAKRSPSPTKLKQSDVMEIISPGTVATWGATPRTVLPSLTIIPQSGIGGETPSPRKLKPAEKTTSNPTTVLA
jgi:hypothetical protein